jgi:hypothetical protein
MGPRAWRGALQRDNQCGSAAVCQTCGTDLPARAASANNAHALADVNAEGDRYEQPHQGLPLQPGAAVQLLSLPGLLCPAC